MFRAIEIAEIAAIVFRAIGPLTSRGVQATVTAADIWVQVSLSAEKRGRRKTLDVDFFPGEDPEKAEFLEKAVRDLSDFDPYEYIEWAKDRYRTILIKSKQ